MPPVPAVPRRACPQYEGAPSPPVPLLVSPRRSLWSWLYSLLTAVSPRRGQDGPSPPGQLVPVHLQRGVSAVVGLLSPVGWAATARQDRNRGRRPLASPVFALGGLGRRRRCVDRRKEKRIATEPRVNDRIRVPRVRVVSAEGEQVGIIGTQEALEMASEQDLDLVEVAPQAEPPVARIMDYGKYKYEQAVRQRESRKKQTQVTVKEMKMRPKIDRHDYETKKGHVQRFLRQGAKVKITIMFRGRETAHTDLGRRLLDSLADELSEIAKIEAWPKLADARNMTMVLAPQKEAIAPKPAPAPKKTSHRDSGRSAPETPAPAPEPEPEPVPTRRPVKVTRAEGG